MQDSPASTPLGIHPASIGKAASMPLSAAQAKISRIDHAFFATVRQSSIIVMLTPVTVQVTVLGLKKRVHVVRRVR